MAQAKQRGTLEERTRAGVIRRDIERAHALAIREDKERSISPRQRASQRDAAYLLATLSAVAVAR